MLMRLFDGDSIGQKAYRQIRTDIVFGKLRPGEKLKLERVGADYDVSISTLREMLSRLVSEGLVIAEGQRGFEVAPVSQENLREIAAMRLLLESHALTQSFQAGDLEWEGRVVSAYHKLASVEKRLVAGERADPETWKKYDWEFHHALISACGSATLFAIHEPVYDKYLRYQMVAGTFRGEAAAREHKKLLDLALAREAKAACDILAGHIGDCIDFIIAKNVLPSEAK